MFPQVSPYSYSLIPNLLRSVIQIQQARAVINIERVNEIRKSNLFKIKGKDKKKIIEGGINSNTELDNSITDLTFFVSKQSQVMAKTEVRGMEANMPANKEDLLAISEIATIIMAVIMVLIIRYIFSEEFYQNFHIS